MDKKTQIIEVALSRFSYYGFAKTTMNEIAEDVHISKANLYYYYSDKFSLIKDVFLFLRHELEKQQKPIIDAFEGGVLGTINSLLELDAEFTRKYYMLYINENLEWVKGLDLEDLFEKSRVKEIKWVRTVLVKGVENKEITISEKDLNRVSGVILETINGLMLGRTIKDIVSGIPDKENVKEVERIQKEAVELLIKGLGYSSTIK
ncbi:MAG TPA: TetR/AcrR family transcriptional regulator [Sphingobacterium sp.]|nr:TetR/AcrR family transcriptional regulator [Sphingobacterium sp.]